MVLELLLLGWVLRRFTRFKRTGRWLGWCAIGLLVVTSFGIVGGRGIKALESQHAPFAANGVAPAVPPGTDVVVLGQGILITSNRPPSSWIGGSQAARVAEGVRIHRLLPESRLLLCIGGQNDTAEEDRFVASVASLFGIEPTGVLPLRGARDTRGEMMEAGRVARHPRIVLVTSAAHMPRAMLAARHVGLDPIPAPCDFLTRGQPREEGERANWSPSEIFPDARAISLTEGVVYEWLGLALERMRGAKAKDEPAEK